MIDPDLFAQAQRARAINTRRPAKAPGKNMHWALSGVALCGSCGKPMRSHWSPGVVCASRADRHDCDEPTFLAAVVDAQIGQLLERFRLPDEACADLVAAWVVAQPPTMDVQAERRKRERLEQRLKDLYEEGDLDLAIYRKRKADIAASLATLPQEKENDEAAGQRLLAHLGDVSRACDVATAAERNQIARQIFVEAIITNGTTVAVTPRPEFRAFFEPFRCQPDDGGCGIGGSDGLRSRGCRIPDGAMAFAQFPARRRVGSSQRDIYQLPRPRRLSIDEEARIRSMVRGRSLRDLAAEFGVSHETIRAVRRSADAARAG